MLFIACDPSGLITFISQAYGGHSSDSFITRDSGFLQLLEDGDKVLADKGFPTLEMKGVLTIIPPRAKAGQKQFTKQQMAATKKIASVRIHIERVIQRMKIFKILSHRLNYRMLPHLTKILKVIAFLVNQQPPIIAAMPSADVKEAGLDSIKPEKEVREEEEEEVGLIKDALLLKEVSNRVLRSQNKKSANKVEEVLRQKGRQQGKRKPTAREAVVIRGAKAGGKKRKVE